MQAKDQKIIAKPLTSTMEDYLEAIYDLNQEHSSVRVRDIAQKLDVKMPTVTSMLKSLNEKGYVNYEKYEYVELTEQGASVGKEMRYRHDVIYGFLAKTLEIDLKTADVEACKIEHSLNDDTLKRMIAFMNFLKLHNEINDHWKDYLDKVA